jgi:hypothetical protein
MYTNVSSHSQSTGSEGNQSRFTPRSAARSQITVARVDRTTKKIIDRLGDHHRSGDIGLHVEHGTGVKQQVDQGAVIRSWIIDQRGKPNGGIMADNIEVILD